MIQLTDEEKKALRQTIMDDLLGINEKTPVDKINKRIEIYIEQEEGDRTDLPAIPVDDINEEDIGDFPDTLH